VTKRRQPFPTEEAEVDRIISPAELAEMLGVSIRTVYAWRATDSGPPAMKVGKHLRYRLSDVEKWLAGAH